MTLWPIRSSGLSFKRLLLLILAAAIFSFALLSTAASYFAFPVLWNRHLDDTRRWLDEAELIELPGDTLFVSDFHLRLRNADLRMNLPIEDVDSVVILGDFFQSYDDFRYFDDKKTDEERITSALRTFLPEGFRGNVYWVSARQHDPGIAPLSFDVDGIHVEHLGRGGHFIAGGEEVFAVHGDDLFDGVPGGGLSWAAKAVGFPMPLERVARKRLGIHEDAWLITAHSHIPAFLPEHRLANTGSFAGVPFNFLLRVHVGTGILFSDGNVELIEFEGIEPTLF